jgi:hypothetical protein
MSEKITQRYAAVGRAVDRLSGRDLSRLTDRLTRNQSCASKYEMMKTLLDLASEVAAKEPKK